MDVPEPAAALRAALPDVLVALDFDGTLAPLQPDPETSHPVDGALDVMIELAGRGAQVAIVTGRGAETAVRLGGFAAVPGIVVAGIYGIETWREGRLDSPHVPGEIEALRQRLPGVLAGAHADPAVWIEDKRLSLVVHGRRARDWEAALDPVREPVARLAAELGLDLHPGAGVLELRVPGFDKAGVLRGLAAEREFRGLLYAGDDLGDVPALEQVRLLRTPERAAYGVAVGTVPDAVAAADLSLPSAAELVALLRRIAA